MPLNGRSVVRRTTGELSTTSTSQLRKDSTLIDACYSELLVLRGGMTSPCACVQFTYRQLNVKKMNDIEMDGDTVVELKERFQRRKRKL